MIKLLTTAEMAEADRLTIAAGTPGAVLMERAGRAVADAVAARCPLGRKVAVVAGPGNNGGDGFVAACILAERGYSVRVLLLGEAGRLKGDAAGAAAKWTGPVEPATPESLADNPIIVDALFGAGLDRPVQGAAQAIIEAMYRATGPVFAVDLPSGISGDTGAVMGPVAVKATETITFFRKKPGHLLLPGRLHCGRVTVADIGIDHAVLSAIKPLCSANEPDLWRAHFPVPRIDGHKYNRGHAVVVSGKMPATGAARLAARGALRAGAGLVTIAAPNDTLAVHAAATTAIMVRMVDTAVDLGSLLADRRHNVAVLGPGGGVGAPMRDLVAAALTSPAAVLLDADALTSFAGHLESLTTAIKARRSPVILTPHSGEFERLFNGLERIGNIKSKLEGARTAARLSEAILLIKGPDTVIASPDGRAAVTANAPPTLATAGAGDVLAGMIAGLLAQGMPAFEAAAAAAWLHGEAANAFGPGLISEDLPEMLPAVYRKFLAG
ncbi:MAG: NAD(P)H-hydrate epimerase/ADP-dependent (S)-NAD(P)H-hydrate dehydratase [Pseudolabrys sp.]|jgi:hydroxyethylthiazole kinase-like uncharacterized protein yjeF|nr:NAD(P)H-hydrate epimerase/ADP-dependent (S)-NAD(P)H-hydrate dehydratase [Pseudolabrys sp.]